MMIKECRNVKKFAIVLTIVLAGILGLCLWNESRIEEQRMAQYEAQEKETLPLNVQYNDLKKELDDLEKSYAAQKEGVSVTGIIFTDMDERIYTDCYPIMKEKEYIGILAVSNSGFPGDGDCMSMPHFQELMADGWKICLKWDAEQPLENWLPAIINRLAEIGMEPGNIMYFPNETYTEEYDAALVQYGFTIAVQHGENNRSLIVTEDEDGVWHPGVVGLQGKEPKARMQEAVTNKGVLFNVVGFRSEDEMYNEKMFQSMLSFCADYSAKDTLLVTDINSAREYCRQRMSGNQELEKNYRQQKEQLEEEMASLKAQIDGK